MIPYSCTKSRPTATLPYGGAQTYFSAGAGSVGTIDDYARFCQMLLNGGELDGVRLLSPTTVAMLLRNQIGELTVWNREDKFGLGFQLNHRAKPLRRSGHAGQFHLGWDVLLGVYG